MNTPIANFLRAYAVSGTARLHMPGHKGRGPLGFEKWDLTEISGADSLYEAGGIIAESEKNASSLFCSAATFYSTEGSSQCIRAMLRLAAMAAKPGGRPRILAARNVHKAFLCGAALLDLDVEWLLPRGSYPGLCSCPITAEDVASRLGQGEQPPTAVYITSPDYLGGTAPLEDIAAICHACGTLLLVDNAHGAYLRFLTPSQHPLDLGADLCCDSAHKTLPVLTGGAYLHLGKTAPAWMAGEAKAALEMFGSTSPSYLTLASLDLCNRALAQEFPERLRSTVARLEAVRDRLRRNGWPVEESDPLRITLGATEEQGGAELAQRLRQGGVECEYADPEALVLMASPENSPEELERIVSILGKNSAPKKPPFLYGTPRFRKVTGLREALLSPHETTSVDRALGRVCASATVSCPPAVPVVVPGEEIDESAVKLMKHYNIPSLHVLK